MPAIVTKLIATPLLLAAHMFAMIMLLLASLNQNLPLEFVSAAVTPICIAIWLVIWRSAVRWSRRRVFKLIAVSIGMTVPAGLCGYMVVGPSSMPSDYEGVLFCAYWAYFYLWIAVALWCLRESKAEKVARLAGYASNAASSLCPTCRYDMTGLKEAKCPECGSTFTLDQLHRAWQPDHAILSEPSAHP